MSGNTQDVYIDLQPETKLDCFFVVDNYGGVPLLNAYIRAQVVGYTETTPVEQIGIPYSLKRDSTDWKSSKDYFLVAESKELGPSRNEHGNLKGEMLLRIPDHIWSFYINFVFGGSNHSEEHNGLFVSPNGQVEIDPFN